MRKLCIISAAGTAKDLLSLVAAINDTLPEHDQWECIGYLDDAPGLKGNTVCSFPVIGPLSMASELPDDVFFAFAAGSPGTVGRRGDMFSTLGIPKERFPVFIHPRADVASGCEIGAGVIVFSGVVLSSSASISDFVIILSNSIVNHDSRLGAFSILASSAVISGNVEIDEEVYIGANASIRNGINVGCGALVGMGSAVVSDVETAVVVCGVPARPLPAKNDV